MEDNILKIIIVFVKKIIAVRFDINIVVTIAQSVHFCLHSAHMPLMPTHALSVMHWFILSQTCSKCCFSLTVLCTYN